MWGSTVFFFFLGGGGGFEGLGFKAQGLPAEGIQCQSPLALAFPEVRNQGALLEGLLSIKATYSKLQKVGTWFKDD